jgi:hypothetical protein
VGWKKRVEDAKNRWRLWTPLQYPAEYFAELPSKPGLEVFFLIQLEGSAMNRSSSRLFQFALVVFLIIAFPKRTWSEPRVQIRSPKHGSHFTHEQNHVLVGGKVFSESAGAGYVDIFLILDVSGSTAQYAEVDFPEFTELENVYLYPGRRNIQSGLSGPLNKRNSTLAAEIVAARRLLSQLNSETTRVGVVTFGEEVWLRQPLTHDFAQVREALGLVYKRGSSGGTNMVDGIRLAIQELTGRGESEKYLDSLKTLILLTDGIPTLPTGNGRSRSRADEDLALSAGAEAGKAGVKIHVFGLGKRAVSYPRLSVGIAKHSGGTYTPVSRPGDVFAVLDKVSLVGVDSLQITNETIGQMAFRSRLAADGFFASAVPVVKGLNRIQVFVRSSDGSIASDTITVHYQPGENRSLELEVFLEQERSLRLEVERFR